MSTARNAPFVDMTAVYMAATKLAMKAEQVVGKHSEYFVTLNQLLNILMESREP